MKRLFFILLFFAVILLCGCQREKTILDYQSKDIVAECVVNSQYKLRLEKTDTTHKITVLEPKEAAGITFVLGERVTAQAGENKIEMDKERLRGICAIGDIFSQSEECLTGADPQNDGSVLTFRTQGCMYKITLGKNSLPRLVHIFSNSFEYKIEIVSIELK